MEPSALEKFNSAVDELAILLNGGAISSADQQSPAPARQMLMLLADKTKSAHARIKEIERKEQMLAGEKSQHQADLHSFEQQKKQFSQAQKKSTTACITGLTFFKKEVNIRNSSQILLLPSMLSKMNQVVSSKS